MAERILVSTRKGLVSLARAGGAWAVERVSFLGHNVTTSAVDPRTGGIFAALNLGHFGVKLHHSTDGGATWNELPVPEYPAGEMAVLGDGKTSKPAKLSLLWSLVPGGADQPGRLWAGTIPGGLFRSDDYGKSWQLTRGLWDREERKGWFGGGYDFPGIHSVAVDPRDTKTIRVAISCGGVWTSADDGTTWEVRAAGMFAEYMPPERRFDPNIQDPHRMTQCPAAPDHLWVQHHNGVFRSTDGAMSWHEVANVPPAVFGFAVGVHPTKPETAWFVPAVKDETRVPVNGEFVVTRTRDGGRSFDVLRAGLPPAPSYDIVYRHALAVDDTGNRLAIGSTTGGFWTSDDEGDTWAALPARLPPVHAVAFA